MQKKYIALTSFTLVIIGIFIIYDALSPLVKNNDVEYGSLILYSAEGKIITQKGKSSGSMETYRGGIDGKMFDAIIEIEDKRYHDHSGVDITAKIAGIRDNINAGMIVRGSSTLTEQYIKNRYYRESERTIRQKIREAIGALAIEIMQSKEQILRNYLDNIYFGNRIYGIQTAIDVYFPGKNPDTLTQDEILDMITRIHSPNISSANVDLIIQYRNQVAKKLGWNAGDSPLGTSISPTYINLYPLITTRVEESLSMYCSTGDMSLQKWVKEIPDNLCVPGKKELHLTLIGDLQDFSVEILQKTLRGIEKDNVTGAAVYIYNPTHQKILAYIGNRGVYEGEKSIDMITRRRSVGSILKPFIYLMALREGYELETLILDDTRIYPTGRDGRSFIPENYTPKSYGPIRLREALGNSLNSATVRISETLGIGRIYDFLKNVGIDMENDAGYYGYGISLGTVEATLENIVESYIYLTHTDDPDIFLIEQALSESKNRAKTFGISSILNSSIGLPVKTGTSTDFRDNWTVSYHRDAIIGVWVGNTDGSPMGDISGVTGAGPIWHTIAEYMIERGIIKNQKINIPPQITETLICLDTNCLQRERTYMKNPESIHSRLLSEKYKIEDFFGAVTADEKKKWKIQ